MGRGSCGRETVVGISRGEWKECAWNKWHAGMGGGEDGWDNSSHLKRKGKEDQR
jgi:hypothetical protein